MSALLRVLRAPWLWLTIGLIQLILAAALALPLRLAVRVAMGPFMIADEGRILAPLLELITDQRPVLAALAATLAGSALLALLIAPLLAGAVITRLAGPQPRGELARAAFTHLPTNFVIGIYGLVLRVLLALVAAALGSLHPLLRPLGLLLGLTFAALAVDLARAHVVLHGARGLHPRAFLRAIVEATQPRLWLHSSLWTVLNLGLSFAILVVAVHGLATAWAPWAIRGLALLGTGFALARVAVAVDHVLRPPVLPAAPPSPAP